jgi:hypothetical protein
MVNPNKCEQCQAFDLETKNLVGEVFHQDETAILTMLVAQSMYDAKIKLNKFHNTRAPEHMKMQMTLRKHIDFCSQMIGKFFVTLEDKRRETLIESLAKTGLILNVEHQKCPHMQEVIAP